MWENDAYIYNIKKVDSNEKQGKRVKHLISIYELYVTKVKYRCFIRLLRLLE